MYGVSSLAQAAPLARGGPARGGQRAEHLYHSTRYHGPPAQGLCSGGPNSATCSAVTMLKFIIGFEDESPYFHFNLGSANYIAGPG